MEHEGAEEWAFLLTDTPATYGIDPLIFIEAMQLL